MAARPVDRTLTPARVCLEERKHCSKDQSAELRIFGAASIGSELEPSVGAFFVLVHDSQAADEPRELDSRRSTNEGQFTVYAVLP